MTAREMAHSHLGECDGEHTKACDMLTVEFGGLFQENAALRSRCAQLEAQLEGARGALEKLTTHHEPGVSNFATHTLGLLDAAGPAVPPVTAIAALKAARETFEIIANPCDMCDADAPYCAANKMHDEADKGMEDIDAALAALATTPAATTAVGLDPATIEACASACEDASGMGDMYARRIRALLAKEGT
jgi:hypothetical protein